MSITPNIIARIQEILISAVATLKEREARFGKSSIETEKATFQQLVRIFCQVCIFKNDLGYMNDALQFLKFKIVFFRSFYPTSIDV